MSTAAQLAANQANAQLSTGPKTETGKAASSRNSFRHGFCGAFVIRPHENSDHYDELLAGLRSEHQPANPTEDLLIERMAQHWWLAQRAISMQELCFHEKAPMVAHGNEKEFALYLRYQTTNERAFHKCFDELRKLRAEQVREERMLQQARRQDEDQRRKQEWHEARLETLQSKTAKAKPAVTPVVPQPTPPASFFAQDPFVASIPGFAQRIADAHALDAAREAELQSYLNQQKAA